MTEQPVKKERKQNSWIQHLKSYSKEHGIAYAAAISDSKCRELYLESKNKPKPEPVPADPIEQVPESQPLELEEESFVEKKPKKPKKKRKRKTKLEE